MLKIINDDLEDKENLGNKDYDPTEPGDPIFPNIRPQGGPILRGKEDLYQTP